MTEQLKPCPFCGESSLTKDLVGGPSHLFVVICNSCDAWGPDGNTESEAIEKWNKRHECTTQE